MQEGEEVLEGAESRIDARVGGEETGEMGEESVAADGSAEEESL